VKTRNKSWWCSVG